MSNPGFSDRAQEPFGDIPTEPEAILLWASQRRRGEGKFELSRGRVRRTEPYATRAHARVCTNIFGELARSLDDELFDVGLSGFGVRTPVGIRTPDVLVDPVNADLTQTYLICSQDEPRAWVWARQSDGSWPKLPTELAGREGAIALGGLHVELSMAAIFRGIPDAPTLG
jgi:hypothetical protein